MCMYVLVLYSCVCMYVCVLGQGRTVIPTGLSINYKSNQINQIKSHDVVAVASVYILAAILTTYVINCRCQ